MSGATNGVALSDATGRHVLIIITGGTICMQDSPDGLIPTRGFLHNCLQPSAVFNDGSPLTATQVINEKGHQSTAPTLEAPPRSDGLSKYKYTVLEFMELIDSSSMNGSHWNLVLGCLKSNWTQFDSFLILHGTDTLAYTASALSFMLGPLDKSVIVTGSQVSMYAPHNDAHDNLLDSLTAAAVYDIPEVSVVFHHHLYRGTRVTKVSAYSMAAFTTPNARPLASFPRNAGKFWSAHVYLNTINLASRTSGGKSSSPNAEQVPDTSVVVLDTSRVAVLKVYPGISANLIESIIRTPNLGGLVLETFGAGNIPIGIGSKNLLDILSAAVKQGVVVVSVTQCLTGSVTAAYESARKMERNGIVTGLDMTTEAAYTKLAYLLSLPNISHNDIAAKMRENLQGELTADFREGQRSQDSVILDHQPSHGSPTSTFV